MRWRVYGKTFIRVAEEDNASPGCLLVVILMAAAVSADILVKIENIQVRWPDAFGQYYWQPESSRSASVEALIVAYGMLGYLPCTDARTGQGFKKLAVCADARGKPAHAPRQLPSNQWTSKLGSWENIEHNTFDRPIGDNYSKVEHILRRPDPADNPASKAI